MFLSLNVLSDMKLHQPALKRRKSTFPAVFKLDIKHVYVYVLLQYVYEVHQIGVKS
jgi:hypothetical protein